MIPWGDPDPAVLFKLPESAVQDPHKGPQAGLYQKHHRQDHTDFPVASHKVCHFYTLSSWLTDHRLNL
jgi:hypothetical protein